jgi:hypothetical protein
MGKTVKSAQHIRITELRLENDSCPQRANNSALAGNAEFCRKIAVNAGDYIECIGKALIGQKKLLAAQLTSNDGRSHHDCFLYSSLSISKTASLRKRVRKRARNQAIIRKEGLTGFRAHPMRIERIQNAREKDRRAFCP